MGRQEGSVILSPSHSVVAGVAVVGPAPISGATSAVAPKSRRRMKVNAIMEAMVSGVMFLAQPAYPHPVPCRGEMRSGESFGGEVVVRNEERGIDKNANSNVPMLPPELYSIIAHHLSSTKETLLNSCSLVSSAWLMASRMYTFRTVKLNYTNVYGFLKLLEDPTCSFQWCVRRLEMREGEYAVDRWMNDVLPRLVVDGRMQGVEVLDVYNLTWAELSPEAVLALTNGFAFVCKDEERGEIAKIKSLRVGTCYWECVHDFVGFVCSPSFAELKTLVCDSVLLNCGMGSCQCRDAENDLAETTVIPDGMLVASRESVPAELSRRLECLYLGLPEEKMLKWFIEEGAVRGIEKLGVVVRETALMGLVGQLVKRVTKVKELALDLPNGCGLSLVNNTRLRSLRVNVDLSLFSSSSLTASLTADHTLAWLVDLISSITSPYIHLLILHLDLTFFSIGDFRSLWPWQEFINVINGLKSMERVVFIVTYCRRRAFNALKEVIQDKTCPYVMGCKVKVRGVRSGFPDSRRDTGSEVWRSWMED